MFPGEKSGDKICVTYINAILLKLIPNIWSKQAYVQVLDCESITFKADVNMFERMEIAESIYEGVVEPSHKKPYREDSNSADHSRKIRV